jgi:hypothetical protein
MLFQLALLFEELRLFLLISEGSTLISLFTSEIVYFEFHLLD